MMCCAEVRGIRTLVHSLPHYFYCKWVSVNVIITLLRLILIAEKMKVYEDFPTPLINRLEKHFITSNTVLKEWQKVVCSELQIWINATFSNKDG